MTLRGTTPDSPDSRPDRRVRRSMYAAFLALAALALFQAGYANRLERVRADDAEIISIAGTQRTFTQQMGRMAALAGHDLLTDGVHAELLTEALDRSRTEALMFEALLAEQLQRGGQAPPVGDALASWQAAREKLWYRAEVFLSRLGQVDGEELRVAAAALQQEVEPSLGAASVLVDRLQAAAQRRSGSQLQLLEAGVALTWLLLGLLAVFVVEPMAREVRGQLRRLRQQTRELERLALVAARTDNVVIVCNAERRIDWVNDAFTRLTDYSLAEAQGCDVVQLLHSEVNDADALQRLRRGLAGGEGLRVELQMRGKHGRLHWVDTDVQAVVDAQGAVQGFLSVGTDVTERRQLQEQLRHAARTDALTGLPNRAVVLDRLQRAILHAQRHPGYGFAVLFMDFDRFKQVNDTLGHSAGDELLRQIARRIEDTLRPGDAVARMPSRLETAARIGGDEFVVVLEGVHSADEASVVAQRLLDVLGEPYMIRGQAVQSGASIGIVTADHAAGSADELLRDADTAMYEAKRAGRGRCVVFDSGMHDRVVLALEMENDLRQALRDHELFVVYQPVVALGTEQMTGVEALVRWRHPTKGLVPPVQFIGVAEEVGLIDAIGQHVLQTACRQMAAWQRTLGPLAPALLAVNLSRAQLQQPGLAAWVAEVLARHGVPPGMLQLEVTESLAAQDDRVQTTLRELKALGVKLALDDFGTGYSSLACLHQLPVDTVKIDRSFVSQAERVEYHRVLIEATIRVAQTLGMTTVAEGIETATQASLMQSLHCDRGQGFLFAKPLTADELAAWALRPRTAPAATLAAPPPARAPLDFADTDTPDTSLEHA